MPEVLRVEVPWTELDTPDHPAWGANFCLYAYFHPTRSRLYYVGKADFQTVRQRLYGRHKSDIYEILESEHGVSQFRIFHGDLLLEPGHRRTSTLLADVETLLIMKLQPPANIKATSSRLCRPGLRVKCTGDWPLKRSGFHDWT